MAGVLLAFIAYSALGHPGGRQAGRSALPISAAGAATQDSGSGATQAAGGTGTATAAGAGTRQSGAATPAPSPTGSAAGQVTGLAAPGSPASTPLVVLDNTGRPAEARFATERFEAGGWTVTDTSTFDGDILSTAAYYDPGVPGSRAAAEALQAQFPEIQRVRPKFDGLGSGAVIVILTYDYSQGRTTS